MKMAEGGNLQTETYKQTNKQGMEFCLTQKREIAELLKTTLKKGDTWYLIDTNWYKQWKIYVGYDPYDTSGLGEQSSFPGPIDNSPLFKAGSNEDLKEHLIDELDYVLLPEKAWNKLVGWYGIIDNQVPFARKVIEHGMFVKHCKVEVYLMDLKLCPNKDLDNVVTKQFSRADTIDVIEAKMREVFTIKEKKDVRLWNKYMTNTYEHLNKMDSTVQDVGLYPGQIIVIEEKNDDGSWPRQTRSTNSAMSYSTSSSNKSGASNESNNTELGSSYSTSTRSGSYSYYGSGSSSSYYSDNYGGGASSQPGLCGLSNLGNTCFMNAALQCMSNVPVLTEYMTDDNAWKNELNYNNPLGMKGEIASSYAELIKNMWSGKYSYTMPRAFKMAVGRFAPTFSGYQQQDSQELMAFLLDGLHEDLNRVKNKPYIELKDGDGMADEVVAKEAWVNYRKRNDSVIVDTFHGQLKSTLICPECQKVSVTFDPFCYLSLPLPLKKERNIKVLLCFLEPERKRRQYKLTVPNHGVVADLCKALSLMTNIPPDKMVVTDVYNHRLHKVFSSEDPLNHILDRDEIHVYEVPVSSSDDPETHVVPVYLREQKEKSTYNNYVHTVSFLFGYPLLVPVPRKNCTYDTLYNHVLNRMVRYVKLPEEGNEWWKSADQRNTNTVNGEMDIDDEGYSENNTATNGKQSDESDEEELPEMEDDWVRDKNGQPRLFKFSVINSYGNAEVDKLPDDDSPIKFTGRMYLAIDWHPRAKKLFYDEQEAKELEVDDSMDRRIKKHTLQLTECLDLFTTREQLGKHDPWYCPQCKEFRQATKKFDLWQLPHILVIHLKRFHYNRLFRDKLDAFVEYPTRGLNMQKWVINSNHGPAVYDLIGVVNHYGGMGGGHYTAYACNKDDQQWYHFDDSSVSQTAEDAVVTKAGYVLVYKRREPPAESTQSQTGATHIIPNGNTNGNDSEEMEFN